MHLVIFSVKIGLIVFTFNQEGFRDVLARLGFCIYSCICCCLVFLLYILKYNVLMLKPFPVNTIRLKLQKELFPRYNFGIFEPMSLFIFFNIETHTMNELFSYCLHLYHSYYFLSLLCIIIHLFCYK